MLIQNNVVEGSDGVDTLLLNMRQLLSFEGSEIA